MLVALSGQIVVIIDSWAWGFEGIIQRFVVTAIGMYVHGMWDIIKEHCSFIAWSFLVYRVVADDGRFTRVLEWCIYAARLSDGMLTDSVLQIWHGNCIYLIIFTPIYLWLALYSADRLLCWTGKLKTSDIWICCAPLCVGTLVRGRNCPSAISTCVMRYQ